MRSAPVGCTAAGLILGTVFINPPRRLARDTSLLADLSIGDHLTQSHDIRIVYRCSSSGVLARGVMPRLMNRSRTSGASSALAISRLSRSTMSRGVLAGMTKPFQDTSVKPGTPLPATVGTPGRNGNGLSDDTPSARRFPD